MKWVVLFLIPITLVAQTRERDADRHFSLGEKAFEGQSWVDAIAHFDTAIAYNPAHFDAFYSRAIAREQTGDLDGAIADYGAMIHLDPDFTETYWNRSMLYFNEGRYDLAKKDLLLLLDTPENETNAIYFTKRYPDDGVSGVSSLETMRALIYNQLGLTAHKLHNYEQAVTYFTTAIELNRTADALINRAQSFEALGQVGLAKNDLRLAHQLDPDNLLTMYNIAGLEDNHDAIATYTQIIEDNPQFAEAYAKRGIARLQTGDVSGAKSDYDNAIKYGSDDAVIWLNRGMIHYEQQNYQKAHSDLSKAIRLNPRLEDAYFNRGNVSMKLEEFENAEKDYSATIRLNNVHQMAFYNRGIARHRQKYVQQACEDVQRAVDLGMNSAQETLRKMCQQ